MNKILGFVYLAWLRDGSSRKMDIYLDGLPIFDLAASVSVWSACTFPLHLQHDESSVCQGHLNLSNFLP